MKTLIMISVAAAALTACGGLTQQQLDTDLAQTATLINAGCDVVQPTLGAAAVATANPIAGVATGVNGVFCASQPGIAASASAAAATAASSPTASK
ncbi:hypothetical protein [Paraburkholderia phenazinium]|uniref:Lipoprotein n=1 Tax=Paraburkholderia phenazinium TaxID=60549 RepID=A0A1N6KPB4_9BURK|nr:hypothetical protein [Paraburkholderia phenazinium]SIO58442.1 hypothetical protein SAMN05444165_4146 [Paraburkholderia phenazinium]